MGGTVRLPSVSGSLRWALVFVALTGLLAGAMEMALLAQSNVAPLWVLDMFPGAGMVYLAVGLVAWWRRPSNRLGMVMVFGGWSWLAVTLANVDDLELAAGGLVLASVPLAVAVHLLLAFPSGQLRSPLARVAVALAYFASLVLQAPLYLFSADASPHGVLSVARLPGLAAAGLWLQRGTGVVVVAIALVVLGGRLQQAGPRQRKTLGPLYLYGMASVLFTPLVQWTQPLFGFSSNAMVTLQVAALIGIPVAFGVVTLLGGFARTSAIEELAAWLGAAAVRPSLSEALAKALGDPSVELAYWVTEPQFYVDGEGRALELPGERSGRGHCSRVRFVRKAPVVSRRFRIAC